MVLASLRSELDLMSISVILVSLSLDDRCDVREGVADLLSSVVNASGHLLRMRSRRVRRGSILAAWVPLPARSRLSESIPSQPPEE